MSKVLQQAADLIERPVKIVYAKLNGSESLPSGGIDLNELTSLQGIDLTSLKAEGKPENVALLPYSR